jgi:hypothetical protein
LALVAAPADFGVYGRALLAVFVAGIIVFLRLERAVIATPERTEAVAATAAAMRIALISLPLVSAAIWFLILELRNGGAPTAMALAGSCTAKSVLLLVFAWLQREGLAKAMALAQSMQALTQLLVQLALLATPLDPVVAMLAGDSAGASVGTALGVWRLQAHGVSFAGAEKWRAVIAANWRLPVLNMPATLASQAATVMPLFAVGAHASPAETGALAIAQRFVDPAFQLCAALATQYAIERRYFARGVLPRTAKVGYTVAYLAAGLGLASAMAATALILAQIGLPWKLHAAITLLWPALAVAFAIYAGGPAMDLSQLANHEGAVLGVNTVTLMVGLFVVSNAGSTAAILWEFAALFTTRTAVILAIWGTDRA